MSNDWRSDFITADKAAELKRFCASLEIVGDKYENFYHMAAVIASNEIDDRNVPTNKARMNYLERALDLSAKLSKAIDQIYFEDKIEIAPLRGILHKDFSLMNVLDDFRDDINKQMEKLQKKGVNGRRKTLEMRALFVGFLWEYAEQAGFTLGRNNDFHRLCDAVFRAAGVPAEAEGALRYFIEKGAPPLEDE